MPKSSFFPLLLATTFLLVTLSGAHAFGTLDFGWPARHPSFDMHQLLQRQLTDYNKRLELERRAQQCASLMPPMERVRFEIAEKPQAYLLRAPLPGVSSRGIRLNTNPSTSILSVQAIRPVPAGCEELASPQRLDRSFRLPSHVDWNNIFGQMNDGFLEIHIPKIRQPEPPRLAPAVPAPNPAPSAVTRQQQPERRNPSWQEDLQRLHDQIMNQHFGFLNKDHELKQPQQTERHQQTQPTAQPQAPAPQTQQQHHHQAPSIVPQSQIQPEDPRTGRQPLGEVYSGTHQGRPTRETQSDTRHQQPLEDSCGQQYQYEQPQTCTTTMHPRPTDTHTNTMNPSSTQPRIPVAAPIDPRFSWVTSLSPDQLDSLLHTLDEPEATSASSKTTRAPSNQRKSKLPEYVDARTHEPLWHHTPAASTCVGCAPRVRPRYADEGVVEL